jgi:hypothetical protein
MIGTTRQKLKNPRSTWRQFFFKRSKIKSGASCDAPRGIFQDDLLAGSINKERL